MFQQRKVCMSLDTLSSRSPVDNLCTLFRLREEDRAGGKKEKKEIG